MEASLGASWVELPLAWLREHEQKAACDEGDLSSGLLMLACGDVIRPGLAWMLTRPNHHLAPVMAETRDPFRFLLGATDGEGGGGRTAAARSRRPDGRA